MRCVLLSSIVAAGSAQGQATYTYTGNHFTDVMGTYTVADRLTGFFTVPAALPSSSSYPTEVSSVVSSFSFNDGVQTLNSANAAIVAFAIGTDDGGNLVQWSIRLWRTPIPTSLGALMDGIHSASLPISPPSDWLVQDVGFQEGLCLNVSNGICDGVNLPSPYIGELFVLADPGAAGTWVSILFTDGFETGNLSQWSGSVP